jgi:formylglycine-generating enzyme required for sulfatase activity
MRGTMKTLLLGLCVVLLAFTGTAQGTDAVAGMAAKYDAKLKEINQAGEKAGNEAVAELKSLLDSLDKKYTAQGNLEGVIAVRKAKEYTVSPDVQIPVDAIPASGPLSEILKHYIQKKTQAEQTHSSSKVALTRAYLSALDRMKESFTKQSKIEEAMTVSVEIERVTQAEPDLVAKVRGDATTPTAASQTQIRPMVAPQKPAGPIPGQPWISPSSIEFVYIRPGTFMMGSPEAETGRNNDERQHRVTLTKGFWLGKYEVTQAQWEAVMGSNPSQFKGADLPVEHVSWNDCQAFIRKLCEKEGMLPGVYRLPTEAEWEFACRAGTTGPYAGNLDSMAWYGNNSGATRLDVKSLGDAEQNAYKQKIMDNRGTTHVVGAKSPNAWGLFDMHGNVWEWCLDWYGDYPTGIVTDPAGPGSGSRRVFRGSSWSLDAGRCRSAWRNKAGPSGHSDDLGLRLLRME